MPCEIVPNCHLPESACRGCGANDPDLIAVHIENNRHDREWEACQMANPGEEIVVYEGVRVRMKPDATGDVTDSPGSAMKDWPKVDLG